MGKRNKDTSSKMQSFELNQNFPSAKSEGSDGEQLNEV